jgi:hypothetical protein
MDNIYNIDSPNSVYSTANHVMDDTDAKSKFLPTFTNTQQQGTWLERVLPKYTYAHASPFDDRLLLIEVCDNNIVKTHILSNKSDKYETIELELDAPFNDKVSWSINGDITLYCMKNVSYMIGHNIHTDETTTYKYEYVKAYDTQFNSVLFKFKEAPAFLMKDTIIMYDCTRRGKPINFYSTTGGHFSFMRSVTGSLTTIWLSPRQRIETLNFRLNLNLTDVTADETVATMHDNTIYIYRPSDPTRTILTPVNAKDVVRLLIDGTNCIRILTKHKMYFMIL